LNHRFIPSLAVYSQQYHFDRSRLGSAKTEMKGFKRGLDRSQNGLRPCHWWKARGSGAISIVSAQIDEPE